MSLLYTMGQIIKTARVKIGYALDLMYPRLMNKVRCIIFAQGRIRSALLQGLLYSASHFLRFCWKPDNALVAVLRSKVVLRNLTSRKVLVCFFIRRF